MVADHVEHLSNRRVDVDGDVNLMHVREAPANGVSENQTTHLVGANHRE